MWKEHPYLTKRNPKNANHQLEKTNTYQKEQYIQGQITKIRNLVEYKQRLIAWRKINEESKKKTTAIK